MRVKNLNALKQGVLGKKKLLPFQTRTKLYSYDA
jgi:hypothetical protein